MNSEMIVNYLCEVLNIKTDNTLIVLDMVEDLKTIKDLAEFKNYIKSRVANLNDDYRYLTGYQKFIKLVDNFNGEKEDQLKLTVLDGVEEKVNKLINKCRLAYNTLDDKMPRGYPYEKVSYENIPNYFDKAEVNLLEQIGGFKRWFTNEGYEENEFKQDLIKTVKGARMNFYKKDSNLIKNKDKEVIKRIGK